MKRYYLTFILLFGLILCMATAAEAKAGPAANFTSEMTTISAQAAASAGTVLDLPTPNPAATALADCTFEFEGSIGGKEVKMKVTIYGMSCAQFFKSLASL